MSFRRDRGRSPPRGGVKSRLGTGSSDARSKLNTRNVRDNDTSRDRISRDGASRDGASRDGLSRDRVGRDRITDRSRDSQTRRNEEVRNRPQSPQDKRQRLRSPPGGGNS